MTATRILVVEDDADIAHLLTRGLSAEGFHVDLADCGAGLDQRLQVGSYDIVVLDRMLPDADGADLCREIRAAGHDVMVLMLTAKDALAEKVDGLGAGADDYMTKPFAFVELLARIEVLLRRAPVRDGGPEQIIVGDLCLDLGTKTARRGDRDLELTATEFSLLRFLAERPDKVQSRVDILKGVWGYNFDPQTNIVEVYIAYLRKKLDQQGDTQLIRNQRGFGYLLSFE